MMKTMIIIVILIIIIIIMIMHDKNFLSQTPFHFPFLSPFSSLIAFPSPYPFAFASIL